MSLSTRFTLLAFVCYALRSCAYTWPDPKYELQERLLYQQEGYDTFGGLVFGVFPCSLPPLETGRTNSAEWLRTAYHDMATANVTAGTGGIDASIGYETERPENVGKFVNASLGVFVTFQSPITPMSDIIALAATMTVGSCSNGSVIVPYSMGRIDATEAGPTGVPEPQDPLETHIADFARQGFDQDEMIALVTCGHTLGGVHGADFPTIVPVLNNPSNQDSRVDFDGSVAFYDNSIATQFVNNISQNPLVFGKNVTTRSDGRIFASDGGSVIKQLAASLAFYYSTCTSLLERMFNTVPKTVTLTPVSVIPVKPAHVYLSVNKNGTFSFTGSVRLMLGSVVSTTTPSTVILHHVPRDGKACSNCTISTTTSSSFLSNAVYSNMPSFQSYLWSTTIPITTGISGFTVEVINGANSTIYGNGDESALFPVQDLLIFEVEKSCRNETFLDSEFIIAYKMTASVSEAADLHDINLTVHKASTIEGTLAVAYTEEVVAMTEGAAIATTGYKTYTGFYQYLFGNADVPIFMTGVTAYTGSGIEKIGDPYFISDDLVLCS